MLKIDNKKIFDYLSEKDKLVKEGRKISSELETLEHKIVKCQDKEKKITESVKCEDLVKKGDIIGKEIEAKIKEIEDLSKQIQEIKLAAIPPELKGEHETLMKLREEGERRRNKIALKVQKIKDKVVPLIHKYVKPLLKEYEDIETAKLEDGKVVIETFNHLEQWKKNFKSRIN